MLNIHGKYLKERWNKSTNELFRALYLEQRGSDEIVRALPNVKESLDVLDASFSGKV